MIKLVVFARCARLAKALRKERLLACLATTLLLHNSTCRQLQAISRPKYPAKTRAKYKARASLSSSFSARPSRRRGKLVSITYQNIAVRKKNCSKSFGTTRIKNARGKPKDFSARVFSLGKALLNFSSLVKLWLWRRCHTKISCAYYAYKTSAPRPC